MENQKHNQKGNLGKERGGKKAFKTPLMSSDIFWYTYTSHTNGASFYSSIILITQTEMQYLKHT